MERIAENPDAFLSMSEPDMAAYYQNQQMNIYQQGYTPLLDSGDPLNPELTYSSGNGAIRCGVRKSTGDGGVPVYLIAGTCETPQGCREVGTGRPVGMGGALGIIYVWQNRLPPLQ
jgi:hypothetical protein